MIDANRQRFWMLSESHHFDLTKALVQWCEEHRVLKLQSSRDVANFPDDRVTARLLADTPPVTRDIYGTWAKPDESGEKIIAGAVFPEPIDLLALDPGEKVLDLSMGNDGVLYTIIKKSDNSLIIYLINRRGSKQEGKIEYIGYDDSKYETARVKTLTPAPGFEPDRIVALHQGGAFVIDRKNRKFAQIIGQPYRDQPMAVYAPHTPRPCKDGPPAQTMIEQHDISLADTYEIIAAAVNPDDQIALLLYAQPPDSNALILLIDGPRVSDPIQLAGAVAPFSLGWIGDSQWAVIFADKTEALVYTIPFLTGTTDHLAYPSGNRYPLHGGKNNALLNTRLCNSLSTPVYYQSIDKKASFALQPLHSLSFSSFPLSAEIVSKEAIDSGLPQTQWHRLYIEAHIPNGSSIIIRLVADDTREALEKPELEWMEHRFGSPDIASGSGIPQGTWVKDASEIPYHEGLLYRSTRKNESGLFTVLIQKPGYLVRTLRGRYLKVKIELVGNGQVGPELAAVRVYGPRWSYLDHYLPELYHEENLGARSQELSPSASGSDFLQRFLCLFEGILTALEDKAANAWMLTNPLSAPTTALPWLAQWLNTTTEPPVSPQYLRLKIKHTMELHRCRGTMKGLALALNIATDLRMSRGDIVLLEDFRLRRTFASILGADLSIDDDPLLAGDIPSANSFVGDTLILGQEEKKEFLALYATDLKKMKEENETIEKFYARLALRLTVLVHQQTSEEELSLIKKIVEQEVPAHIDYRVILASKPLITGLYSLVGVDTYLQNKPPRKTARVGDSFLGRNSFIEKLPVLDDRLEP